MRILRQFFPAFNAEFAGLEKKSEACINLWYAIYTVQMCKLHLKLHVFHVFSEKLSLTRQGGVLLLKINAFTFV